MSNTRVLHICQRDDASTGGAVRVGVDLVNYLSQNGWDAHCLFVYGSKNSFGDKLGVRAHYLGLNNSADVFRQGLRLRKFIQSFGPAIIHHHDGLLWTYLMTVYLSSIKKVTHAHVAGGVRSFGYRTVVANRVQRFATDLLVCISEHTRQTWLREGYEQSKTCVIPNGVDAKVFYPASVLEKRRAKASFGIPEEAMVVGFVGRLHNVMKGTDDYLKVVAGLPENYWGLVIGRGQDEMELKTMAKELGISERVVFAGALQDSTAGYHAMDALAFTSHFEHFGLVIIEAMACQIPVVGFACPGGISEILTDMTGVVLPKRDCIAMSRVLKGMPHQKQHWQERIQQAATVVDQYYDWQKITIKLSSYYDQLLN